MRKEALDTPALVVDLDILEGNIRQIAETCRRAGVGWRPHVKGQKTIEMVRRELAAGAVGITCAKLGEAEALLESGVDDILIANQIVGASKIERLVRIQRRARVMPSVDCLENVAAIGAAASLHAATVPVMLEIDTGMGRAGVAPGAAALDLARAVRGTPGVELAGVMTWEGHTTRIGDPAAKRAGIGEAIAMLVDSADRIRCAGMEVPIVSCGGTGTYETAAFLPGITEIQAGGGAFSDLACRDLYHVDRPCALTVMTTVVSRPSPRRIVCDTGKKSMSSDTCAPQPLGLDGVTAVRLSAEHAIVELAEARAWPVVGDRLEFVVGYADTTVHLHDEIYASRDGVIREIWPVVGRGRVR